MCSRYYFDDDTMNDILSIVEKTDASLRGMKVNRDIYPTDDAAVIIRNAAGGIKLSRIKWGYPGMNGSGVIINARAAGDSMCEEGITEGDILIVDRSIEAEHGDLAVCCINGEFTLKRLCLNRGDKIYLMPSNRKFRPIEVTRDDDFMVWGVVMYTIKANRRRRSGTQRW